MELSNLNMLGNLVAAAGLAAVAASILLLLSRSGPLRRNRLDLAAALVFLSVALGHGARLGLGLGRAGPGGDWMLALGDVLTAVLALGYLWLRRTTGSPEEGGALYEEVRRRQHELAGQAMAANVREELATERAAAAEQRLARVFASAPVGMAMVDPGGRITRANPALSRILGREPGGASDAGDELDQVSLTDLVGETDRPGMVALMGGDDGEAMEMEIPRSDGTTVWGRLSVTPLGGEDAARLVQIEDTTERHRAEAHIEHLAGHDPLTGLPNRRLLTTRAAAALRQANRTGCYVGCLFVDLDNFRVVNDSLGHGAGDRVLTTMADRLAEVVRPGDTVARVGDDEFCLLLVGLEHQTEAEIVANRVRRALDGVLDVDGVQVSTSACVGVAVARPGDRATSDTLVRDADVALSQAKAPGVSRTVVFDAELRQDALRRLQSEVELGAR